MEGCDLLSEIIGANPWYTKHNINASGNEIHHIILLKIKENLSFTRSLGLLKFSGVHYLTTWLGVFTIVRWVNVVRALRDISAGIVVEL